MTTTPVVFAPSKNLRDLLHAIGMGHFNITMAIPYMMLSPSTCDPKSAQVMLIVQHLQRALYALGATDVAESGRLDLATANALLHVTGPNWERMPWSASAAAVVRAKEAGTRIGPGSGMDTAGMVDDGVPVSVGGPLDFLPDVPGGIVTYGIAAYLLYRHFKRHSKNGGAS